MDAIRKFQNAFSRALYVRARKEVKCPPVIAMRLSPAHWGWYVEMKDGSFSMDQVDAVDIWEAKCKCIEGWQAQQSEKVLEEGK